VSDDLRTLPGGLSLPAARRVERVCTDFEAAWRGATTAGARPRVEDYLGTAAGVERSALACELILLEVFYRRQAGEDVLPQEYQNRFPELDRAWLAQAVGAPPKREVCPNRGKPLKGSRQRPRRARVATCRRWPAM
jgi:hypothetical protein